MPGTVNAFNRWAGNAASMRLRAWGSSGKTGDSPSPRGSSRQTLGARTPANPGEATGVCQSGQGSELSIRQGVAEPAVPQDPPHAAHVPRTPERAQPTPAAPGALRLRRDAQTQAQPRPRSGPCLRSARTHRSDSPAPAPGKVWWRGGRGGQAARCSAAAGAPRELTGRRGAGGGAAPRGASREGGRKAETRAPGLQRPRLRAPRAALTPGEGASGSDTFHTRPGVGAAQEEHPSLRLRGGEPPRDGRER